MGKVIFIDIDGTLLNSKHQISEKTKKKVNDLKIKTKCQELILIHYWKPVVTSVT